MKLCCSEMMKETKLCGRSVRYFDCIDSTNVRAKQEAENGAESGTIIVADQQTAGRGRRGRSWDSPAGKNLYFTLILRPEFAPDRASQLTLVMALAVARGMERTMAVPPAVGEDTVNGGSGLGKDIVPDPMIKWPNDVVLNGRKVCGILTEMSVQQNAIRHVLIGVGINVREQEFAPELVEKATALESECGQQIDRESLLVNILEAFDEYYTIFEAQSSLAGLRELYDRRLVNRGREVRVLDPQGEYNGIATGISDTGELCVTLSDGSATQVYAGEVSVRGIYGYV